MTRTHQIVASLHFPRVCSSTLSSSRLFPDFFLYFFPLYLQVKKRNTHVLKCLIDYCRGKEYTQGTVSQEVLEFITIWSRVLSSYVRKGVVIMLLLFSQELSSWFFLCGPWDCSSALREESFAFWLLWLLLLLLLTSSRTFCVSSREDSISLSILYQSPPRFWPMERCSPFACDVNS